MEKIKISAKELKEILELHNKWLNGQEGGVKANLSYANLSYTNLSGADLRGANLDYNAWPLWCGGLHADIDDAIATQLLYHTLSNALGSKNTSDALKAVLSNPELIDLANRFHRTSECGEIEVKPHESTTPND